MGPSMGSHGFTQALVAQRIRASDYGSEGREFESLQARFSTAFEAVFFWLLHNDLGAIDLSGPSVMERSCFLRSVVMTLGLRHG